LVIEKLLAAKETRARDKSIICYWECSSYFR